MIGLIVFGSWVLGWLIFVRPLAWALAKDSAYSEPDTEDLIMGVCLGAILAIFWPISGTIYLLARYNQLGTLIKPSDVKREDEVKALQHRIHELERETGVAQ